MKKLYRLSDWLYRLLANPYALITSTAIFALFLTVVLPVMAGRLAAITGADISPDTSFIYNSEALYRMAETFGPEGRAYYIFSRFTFDIAWPIAYLLFLTTVVSFLFNENIRFHRWRFINLIPLAGAIFDLLENSAASLVMYRYPLPTPVVAELTPIFTFLKWILIGLSFALLLLGIFLNLSKNKNT